MFALLDIAILLVVVALIGRFVLRGKNRLGERQQLIDRRVDAYMHTIRREARSPDLAAMTDIELRDLLLSSAHNLRVDAERRSWILMGACGAGLIAAIVVATQDGWRGFGLVLLIAAVAVYGLSEFLSRRMLEPLKQRGIDIERLRVE